MGDSKVQITSVFYLCLTAIAAFPNPETRFKPDFDRPAPVPDTKKGPEITDNVIILPSDRQYESDIFWRPWNHYIPKDAVVAGYRKGECGKRPIYLAQAYKSNGSNNYIIPTEIFTDSGSVKFSYGGGQIETRRDIRVLCTSDPSILTWISQTEASKINITIGKDCVVGGSEKEQKFHTYFGRAEFEGNTFIGKVLYHENVTYIPYFGEEKRLPQYEILCYKKAIEGRREEAVKREAEQKEEDAWRKPEETQNVSAEINTDETKQVEEYKIEDGNTKDVIEDVAK